MDHIFDIDHAKRYGVVEAIIIKHFIFWIGKNKADGKNFMDGKTWSYNSVKGFEAIFPYLTKKQIWNALNNLKDVGVLATGNYNKTSFDKTLWYAFMEEEAFIGHIKVTQVVDFSDFPSRENRSSPQGKSNIPTRKMEFPPEENGVSPQGKPIPDNLPDNLPDNNTSLREVGDSAADAPLEEDDLEEDMPTCPHTKIINIYHEVLSMCPQVKNWTKNREQHLRQRWKEDKKRQTLEWWRSYFEYVAKSKFLTAQVEGRNGKPPFLVNLEWLVRPSNLAKVVEGNYHRVGV